MPITADSKGLCAERVDRFSLSFNHYETIGMGIIIRLHTVEKRLVQTLSKGGFWALLMGVGDLYVCL